MFTVMATFFIHHCWIPVDFVFFRKDLYNSCDVLKHHAIMDTLCVTLPLRLSYNLAIHQKNGNLQVAATEDQMFDVMRESDVTFTATGSKACRIVWSERGLWKLPLNDLAGGKIYRKH